MNLPIGYFKFHKNKFINYQLNRWYSLGYARKEDIENLSLNINTFEDYVNEFEKTYKIALNENRLKNAATYKRASEFLISPNDKRKIPFYEEFIEIFYKAFSDENIERFKIPYENSYLSTIKLSSKNNSSKGTIIACGGFDSYIEEFFCIWNFFAENGYDVIAFEGPGQGTTLRKYGLTFDHDWEKPTKEVLDFFNLDNVTAIGVSMGGYWIMRASAFEKRINRVVSWSPVYDWLEMTNTFNKKLVSILMNYENLMNFLIKIKMNVPALKHTINNALFIQNKNKPIDAVRWMLGMNKKHLHSNLITQDVLLITGENDAFQPPILLYKQKEALINAKSVSERIFNKSENADQHCQMGNIGLALETILTWINEKNS